jgi:hypothetical protein
MLQPSDGIRVPYTEELAAPDFVRIIAMQNNENETTASPFCSRLTTMSQNSKRAPRLGLTVIGLAALISS